MRSMRRWPRRFKLQVRTGVEIVDFSSRKPPTKPPLPAGRDFGGRSWLRNLKAPPSTSSSPPASSPASFTSCCTSAERDPHSAIDAALLFDARHRRLADLLGVQHMGPAARLQVDPFNFNQSYASGAGRGFHRHGFDEARIGGQFII